MNSISVGQVWVYLGNEGNHPSAVFGLYGAGDGTGRGLISAGRLQHWLACERRGAQPKNVTLTRMGSFHRIGGIFLPGECSCRVLFGKFVFQDKVLCI